MAAIDLGGLVTEGRNPRTMELDTMELQAALLVMNDEDAGVAAAVRTQAAQIAAGVRVMTAALRQGGRVFYIGAGTSGRLGILDAAECPPTFGTDPERVQALMAGGGEAAGRAKEGAEDDADAGREDLRARGVTARDAIVGLAASGRTPYVAGAMAFAREVGARTIAVVCNPAGPLIDLADVAIVPVVGPEVVMGSTRLKAGTAQKLVLNMLSTMTMVQLGKVYTNLMVDMHASNVKLKNRAVRMLRLATGLAAEEAEHSLAEAGGSLKAAIVSHLAGVSPAEAKARLEAADGRVREALAAGTRPQATVVGEHSYYLGIDGGQSGTRCLIIRDDGAIHGAGAAGKVSHVLAPGGVAALASVLREAVGSAMGAARVPLSAAFLGLSGIVPGGRLEAAVRRAAAEVLPDTPVYVDSDGAIALAGALTLRPGLIAIAGSGSLVLGVDTTGRAERAGGWGYLFGDEPGAFGIALAAIKRASREADSGEVSSRLHRAILGHFRAGSLSEITRGFYASELDRVAIASLTPVLALLAAEGDDETARIFREAATVLADQMVQVAGRLSWPADRVEWSPIGGVFRCGDLFIAPLRRRLEETSRFEFILTPPQYPPVTGAALLAVTRSGRDASPALLARLSAETRRAD